MNLTNIAVAVFLSGISGVVSAFAGQYYKCSLNLTDSKGSLISKELVASQLGQIVDPVNPTDPKLSVSLANQHLEILILDRNGKTLSQTLIKEGDPYVRGVFVQSNLDYQFECKLVQTCITYGCMQ